MKVGGAAAAAAAAAAGAPAPTPGAQLRGAGGLVETLVEGLRRSQEQFGAGNLLMASGLALTASGVVWGLYTIMVVCPFLLCILGGLAAVALALVMLPGGLLTLLPGSAQEFLLQKTWFDFLYDNSAFENLSRKWVRMLMLCYGEWSPADVRAVTYGLDPAFVDMVFRRTFFQQLPPALRTVLLPTPRPLPTPGALVGPTNWPRGSEEERIQIAAATGAGSVGPPSDFGGPPLTPPMIVRCLGEKLQEKNMQITEPDLGLAINGVFGIRPTIFRFGEAILCRTKNLFVVSALFTGASAAFLYLPYTRDLFLRGLMKLPLKQGLISADGSRSLAVRGAQLSSFLGLCSAGGWAIAALAMQSVASMREVLPTKGAAPVPAAGAGVGLPPMGEESPTGKERELQKQVRELEARLRDMHLQHHVEQEASQAELRSRLAKYDAHIKDLEVQLASAGHAVGEASGSASNGAPSLKSKQASQLHRPHSNGGSRSGAPMPAAGAAGAEGLRRREAGAGLSAGETD